MSKKIIKHIPNLRFPEFVNELEWKKVKLSKLGKLVSGLTYSPDDVRKNGLLVLRSSNVQDGEIRLEDNVYVRTDIKGANLSEPNDILICVRNGSKALIGKNALIPDNMPLCTHGAFMTTFRAESPKFVFQLFQTKDYQKQVNADLGATINSINGNKFIKYEFNVPSTEKEQTKIADCLSSIDSIISAQCQKVELLKEHKNGFLQNIFPKDGENVPKYRFPEFINDRKWKKTIIGKLGNFYYGKSAPKWSLEEDALTPCVRYGELYTKFGTVITETYSRTNIDPKNLKFSKGGEILIPRVGEKPEDFGKCCCYLPLENIAIGEMVSVFETSQNPLFYTYYFRNLYKKFANVVEGQNVKNLYYVELEPIEIYCPSPEEQQKIADCLTSIDEEINLQIQKIELLKKHKKALLQQLFPSNEVING